MPRLHRIHTVTVRLTVIRCPAIPLWFFLAASPAHGPVTRLTDTDSPMSPPDPLKAAARTSQAPAHTTAFC